MSEPVSPGASPADASIADLVRRERSRLAAFIRRRVADPLDAEDVLQDVFAAFIDANRRLMPIEHVTAWLYRAARNRMVDLFRKKVPERFVDHAPADDDGAAQSIDDLVPSSDDGPEALALRQSLVGALEAALAELPTDQRNVFLWHELEGRTFAEMSAATGVSINTLLARKRYAVRRLRARLHDLIDDLDD